MSLIYVHLSDIHFGQEKGGQKFINDDAKNRLIDDVQQLVASLPEQAATGIIISGDIAYAGKKSEYEAANLWLDKLTIAAKCSRTEIQVVPGNHDIDRSAISKGTQTLIDAIIEGGDDVLDGFLESDSDRELLHRRFADYREFAAAYNCSLDEGGIIVGHRTVEIGAKRFLRFHGINTALICSTSKIEEGSLLLGKRQRVIPVEQGVETVVIAHHPIHWLQDSEDALKYIKNRARIFISGHEHKPSHNVIDGQHGQKLLSIAAGATAPPTANSVYTYCYNVLQFDWDEAECQLILKIHPRIWDDEHKQFVADDQHCKLKECEFKFGCSANSDAVRADETQEKVVGLEECRHSSDVPSSRNTMTTKDDEIRFVFFRKLNSSQRLAALSEMNALPPNFSDRVTHNIEMLALRQIFSMERSDQLRSIIDRIINQQK